MKAIPEIMKEPGNVITMLLAILCVLASLDLWRQYALSDSDYWFYQYSLAMKSDTKMWKLGFRLEDLEYKIIDQKLHWNEIWSALSLLSKPFRGQTRSFQKLHKSTHVLQSLLVNESSVYQIRCESDGPYLRVGMNDYRTDKRDSCQIFTSALGTSTGPLTMFETIPLGEGSFGLRSVANGMFLRTVPPPETEVNLPWKIVIGGPNPGASERFFITEDGYLYSPLMGGVYQCHADDIVKGYAGIYSNRNHFFFESVTNEKARDAYDVVSLSRQISNIQKEYAEKHKTSIQERNEAVKSITGMDSTKPVRICIAVPMTSKGTEMTSVTESPLWSNLFDSFMKTVDWRSNRMVFAFYLGFDKADDIYDTGDAWSEMRDHFHNRAVERMRDQQVDNVTIEAVMNRQLKVKIMHFEHLQGAPTQVVSQLVLQAYVDNYDYFYQVNDDTSLISPNWAPDLIRALASNPVISNFGVSGPVDTNNEKIFTHAFVHRTHIEVFNHLFPPSFKNWWSDDWISTVYGREHTFRVEDIKIKHNVGSQKTKGYTRYEVDEGARLRLDDELKKGHVQIDQWLKKNSYPRLLLPEICGFIPLSLSLTHVLRAKENKTDTVFSSHDRGSSSSSSSSSSSRGVGISAIHKFW
eukprot:CAMPEP_0182437390 /NCGR_PEP_ID=MMETSP1167-20130531/85012_1 /TAXON_ID=2988 /ORGANISM="Mallomonas Sp, Strain CCMP3275" /LENGTH=635 /DNA_ID=CAMNT_0024630287 /DNA_START=37 /DNA_END=1944 /DNA_ORIENTATION=-